MLVYYMFVIMLLLHSLFIVIFSRGSVTVLCACNFIQNKDRFIVMLASSVRLCSVSRFKAPEWFLICWQIAFHSYMSSYMAFSRKYGTVWYHPASSKLWYLTILSFVNFQGKLLARFGICSCVKPACSACCVLDVGCGFCVNTLFGTPGGTIVAESKMPEIGDILDVTIEDLSPEQLQQLKDAKNQFQLKCLMSFKKNRSGVPYLKNEMPRVLLLGETDATSLQEKEEALQAF
jgi:hypothetical protein